MADPTISIAFRFHVNFYHSYRGDSLDDRGIGPDIRVIRSILDSLDSLNARGIPVCGTWDIENYYSLEQYIPQHAPDILERIQARVAAKQDEVELMSWNNGLISAHTREEFDRAIGWAITNPAGSGLADLFASYAPIVRPQECMLTPSQIPAYREHGVEAVSIYYSALPFNGFSTFVPLMPLRNRYNPLTLRGPDDSSITLLPAYNHGDIADHLPGLRHWARTLRRKQIRGKLGTPRSQGIRARGESHPDDLLLLIDMDADDVFWEGIDMPILPRLFRSFSGLTALVEQVASLDYVRFVRPYDYLRTHSPVDEISFGQDTADGSFDGYSSWAEKRENHEIWGLIDEARVLCSATRRALTARAPDSGGAADPASTSEASWEALDRSLTARLLAMSTTHFGLASPVMNADRLNDARRHARTARDAAREAWANSRNALDGSNAYYDPETELLSSGEGARGTAINRSGKPLDKLVNPDGSTESFAERGAYQGDIQKKADGRLRLTIDFDQKDAISVMSGGTPLLDRLGGAWFRYDNRVVNLPANDRHHERRHDPFSRGGYVERPGAGVRWSERIWHPVDPDRLYIETTLDLPETPPRYRDKAKASRLAREWDARWQEIAPCELIPNLGCTVDRPATVWKHNFMDDLSSFALNYHQFSRNRDLDSSNNQITDGWIAVSGPERGILVAYDRAGGLSSFAFCPIRTRIRGARQEVRLNPFGTYYGRQWHYPSAATGFGRMMALQMADQLDSYAPSYAGWRSTFGLMVAFYRCDVPGGPPPEGLQRDALLFSTPAVGV